MEGPERGSFGIYAGAGGSSRVKGKGMISIMPRTVKEQNGLRPFQKSTLDALNSEVRMLLVEAPVGAGKSYIIRRIVEDEHLSGRPVVLTYPTKILMSAQINALKKELKNVKHWPDESEICGDITLCIGNIISMSKSLGYTVPAPIEANIHHLKEVKTCLKGTPMLGFIGTFSVNFEIPDYWGIGKSVSKGFGTVVKVNSDQ